MVWQCVLDRTGLYAMPILHYGVHDLDSEFNEIFKNEDLDPQKI